MKNELRKYIMVIVILFLILIQISANTLQIDTLRINVIIKDWSNAHNSHNINKFSKLYASKVLFYCMELSRDECIKRKFKLLESGTTFSQYIVSPITYSIYENGIIKCDFTKEVLYKGTKKNYPSYLLIKMEGKEFLIVGESDRITDINLKYKLKLGPQVLLVQQSTGAKSKQIKTVPTRNSNLIIKTSATIYLVIAGFISIVAIIIFYYRGRLFHNRNKEGEITNINIDIKSNIEVSNKNKGDEFEEFVVQKFNKKYFTLLNWRSDKGIAGIFPESNKYPDLEFQFNYNNYFKAFAIECKFRQEPKTGIIEIAHSDQLTRYRNFQSETKMQVYLVLGLGGIPTSPNKLYLIPLSNIGSTKMSVKKINQFSKTLSSNFFFSTVTHELT